VTIPDASRGPDTIGESRVHAVSSPHVDAQTVAEIEALEGLSEAAKKIEGRSPWRLAWERLRRDRAAMISLVVIILLALMAIVAPLLTKLIGHGPNTQYLNTGLTANGLPKPPSHNFVLGTDDVGRDILSRVIYGARISLLVGVVSTAFTVAIAVVVGITAGYFGGIVDTVLSRFMDIMLAFPFLLFAIALVSVLHPSLAIVIVVIAVFQWAAMARVVRGQVLSIREKEYVEAARSLGARDWRIMFVDIFPNVLAPVIVYATILIPVAIVAEASLSFLGLGVPPPTADWGSMLDGSVPYYQVAWWYALFPGLALLITTLAFNLFGDGVRDAFDPRSDRLFST
jgi:peptide/nickel transport system permease protein